MVPALPSGYTAQVKLVVSRHTRMRDYYADTQFDGDELERLVGEIEALLRGCAGNPGLAMGLQKILAVCQQARAHRLKIWVLSD